MGGLRDGCCVEAPLGTSTPVKKQDNCSYGHHDDHCDHVYEVVGGDPKSLKHRFYHSFRQDGG